MVTSKRVANAKSERHYRNTGPLGKKKQVGFWQGMRKQVSTHPLLVLFFLVITVTSGIVSFMMNDRHSRSMFGGTSDDLDME